MVNRTAAKWLRDSSVMMLVVLLSPALIAGVVDAEDPDSTATQQIELVIRDQERAWNRGDLDAFMTGYWKSEALTFSSGGEVTRGWQATSDRYHRRYATRADMGKLTFSGLEIRVVGDQAAYVLGDWQLERAADAPGGNFTLVFGRIEGAWKIMHDHTSSRETE